MNTLADKPFCGNFYLKISTILNLKLKLFLAFHYQVRFYVGTNVLYPKISGTLILSIENQKWEINSHFERSSTFTKLFVQDFSMKEVQKIQVNWISNSGLLSFLYLPQQIHLTRIEFLYMSHMEKE